MRIAESPDCGLAAPIVISSSDVPSLVLSSDTLKTNLSQVLNSQFEIRNSKFYSYLNPSTGSSRDALQEGYKVERKLIAIVRAATARTSVTRAWNGR